MPYPYHHEQDSMTVLRCSQKLLKRLRQPGALPTPVPQPNPLGEWCADIDFINRQPFVLLMNAATGLTLVLPGHAEFLRRLHECAAQQLAALLDVCAIRSPLADAEIEAWQRPCVFARSTDRSLVSSMNQRKYEAWAQFAYSQIPAFDVACRLLDTPFRRKDLGRDFHVAIDLVRARLMPSAKIIPFEISSARH